MAAPGIEDKIETYVKQQPEWFENLVLGCAIQDMEFFLRVQKALCRSLEGNASSDDFQLRLRNPVYTAAAVYNSAHALHPGRPFTPINAEVMAIMLRNKADDADGILPDEIPEALRLFHEAMQVDVARWKSMVELGITRWLTDRKMMQVIQSPYMFGGWSLAEVRARLALVEQQSSSLDTQDKVMRGVMGFYLDHPELVDDEERLLTNLGELNNVLGGGFVKGDTALVISPPSGGKTILACQLAGYWSTIGVGGIFVTTEQPQVQLERRLLSNFAKIPFNQVVNEWNPAKLDEKQLMNYRAWRDSMKAPIQVVDWTIPGNTILANLRGEIEHYIKAFNTPPEYLIFDWIGSALAESVGGDPDKIRWKYKEAVDTCVNLCKEYNMVGIVLAQAAPGKSLNKFPLTIEHIAEAKNMSERTSVVIGLTALFAENMDEETDHAKVMYHERQYLCASKSRKGPGGNARIKRRYDYQRLENY